MISEVRVLLVFDSAAVRRLLSRFLMSELENVSVFVAGDAHEASQYLRNQPLDVVLCGLDLAAFGEGALYRAARGSARNRETPFVVVGADSTAAVSRWIQPGACTVLPLPFTSAELHACVRSVFNARSKRSVDRFHVEGAEARAALPGGEATGAIINLSTRAALVEMVVPREAMQALMRTPLVLDLPLPSGHASIRVSSARLLKLHILDWTDDARIRMRLVWQFESVPESDRDRLNTGLMDVRTFSTNTLA